MIKKNRHIDFYQMLLIKDLEKYTDRPAVGYFLLYALPL